MLNSTRALELAEQVVAGMGEHFVYNIYGEGTPCFNVPLSKVRAAGKWDHLLTPTVNPADPREKTGCLVGEILTLALDEPLHHDKHVMAGGISSFAHDHPGLITPRAVQFLIVLQSGQDNGRSWGEVLSAARFDLDNYLAAFAD